MIQLTWFYTSIIFFICLFKCVVNSEPSPKYLNLMDYLQPNDIGRNKTYDGIADDGKLCSRDCTKFNQSRICYYEFFIEQYHAMGPACDGCPQNISACFNPQCVVADGVERSIISVNRQYPAPSIQVCFGDRVIVRVKNNCPARDIGIHWHGMLQVGTPYMDGIPHVTQCPIPENGIFQYDFYANTTGTHFYHGHSGFHVFDGLASSLIVRRIANEDPMFGLYDYDLFSHVMHIADWVHYITDDRFPGYNKDLQKISFKADTYLINGLGVYTDPVTKQSTGTPFANFVVTHGKKYRFRIFALTSETCSLRVTIEKHSMQLIAVDGYSVEPVTVRALNFASAEAYDVVINANQTVGSYWIRVEGLDFCANATQFAVLTYEGSATAIPTTPNTDALFNQLPYPDLNNCRFGCINNMDTICMDELSSVHEPPEGLWDQDAERYVFTLGTKSLSKQELFNTNSYLRFSIPFAGPSIPFGGMYGDTINNKSCIMPASPLITHKPPKHMLCPKETDKYMECLHLIKLKMHKVVEIILVDDVSDTLGFDMIHPIHLHGYYFWVLKQATRAERQKDGGRYADVVKRAKPAVMDTIDMPPGGYVKIRFIPNNPGMWLFHCHLMYHLHGGMFLIFQVGKRCEFPPIPHGFPTCADYIPPIIDEN